MESIIKSFASPIAEPCIVDHNSPRRQLLQQLRYAWCELAIAWDDHCPFQVFPELSRANAPPLQSDRRRLPNLYERPVPGKGQRRLSIREWAAHDEVIVPMHQNSDHGDSRFEPRIGNGAADCKMIDHLPREFAGIRAWTSFEFVPPRLPRS
jgi:hypothetical protein